MATILKTDGSTEVLNGTGGGGELLLEDYFPIVGGLFDQLRNTSDSKVRLLIDPDGFILCKPENAQATTLASTACGYEKTVYGDAVEITTDTGDEWY